MTRKSSSTSCTLFCAERRRWETCVSKRLDRLAPGDTVSSYAFRMRSDLKDVTERLFMGRMTYKSPPALLTSAVPSWVNMGLSFPDPIADLVWRENKEEQDPPTALRGETVLV
mmetsp:Transcript_51152/g.136589  ORF Transcript_51152/g.136589 Transcript_51152/m.136589 type:complete len:113 (-) Transcript_51152:598-936(-)